MDPTSPEFRPRFQPESTRPESGSSQSTNHRPPAGNSNDPQWRTKCRTCGEEFKSRNQLMRHLYRSHPLKPGKSNAPAKTAKPSPPQPPLLPTMRPAAPKPEQSSVHPFALLPHRERLAFVGHAMRAIFAVGMKQLEEEQAQQRGGNRGNGSAQSQTDTPALPTPNSRAPLGAHTGAAPAAAPDQMYQRGQGDDLRSEDSDDDEDGGAPLYGSAYGELPLPPQGTEDELSWLDQIDDLD